MRIFENPNYNFIQWRWHAIALSLVVILAGVGLIVTRGLPLGTDFSGGTIVVLKFQQPVAEDRRRTSLDAVPGEKVVQQYGDAGANEFNSMVAYTGRYRVDGDKWVTTVDVSGNPAWVGTEQTRSFQVTGEPSPRDDGLGCAPR